MTKKIFFSFFFFVRTQMGGSADTPDTGAASAAAEGVTERDARARERSRKQADMQNLESFGSQFGRAASEMRVLRDRKDRRVAALSTCAFICFGMAAFIIVVASVASAVAVGTFVINWLSAARG
jgi:hypothetical protein